MLHKEILYIKTTRKKNLQKEKTKKRRKQWNDKCVGIKSLKTITPKDSWDRRSDDSEEERTSTLRSGFTHTVLGNEGCVGPLPHLRREAAVLHGYREAGWLE